MLLKQKFSNALKKEAEIQGVEIEIYLDNIYSYGCKKGCSGHILNALTGSCVYVTTESSGLSTLRNKSMYRLAKDRQDWSSNSLKNGFNRWVKNESLVSSIISALKNEKGEEK